MKSVTQIKQSDIKEKWYLVDASGMRIGNLASKVAEVLQGKNNPLVRRYHKPLNKVVVINAKNIDFTFKRGMSKFYKNYSGFPGGLKFTNLEETFTKHPERPIEIAVKGMLPKNKRGDDMFNNLKVYADENHPHTPQEIEKLDIRNIRI
ncbi:50S ribosomal protein L13 [Candidatus Dojkabacteria bacterium]|jgi:large subunit ribosomal protein L13|nr:50S ribosomal protein L13 [Candidatus Dojkabacteria bacterium]